MPRSLMVFWVLSGTWTPLVAQQPQPAKHTLEFSGLVLANGFFNSAAVNNSDVPEVALPDATRASAAGATIRQTRVNVLFAEPDVLRGMLNGEVDTDFFGGQEPSAGGRKFPLLRIRRALGTVTWDHAELLLGQESPLVAERSPRSFAAVGYPDFAGAGNLWLWSPQLRGTYTTGYATRFALQAAILAPTEGQGDTSISRPDSAERSGRPYFQGRVRFGWGPTDDPSEVAIGGHIGWLAHGDTLLRSAAVTADARFKFGVVEIIGEAFTGQALAGLGGGGIGQNLGPLSAPVRTKGGWGQLNLRPSHAVLLGGGCGIDDPDDRDLKNAAGVPQGRLKNVVCEGHVHLRPSGPIVVAFEWRSLKTTYPAGDFTANHLNFAGGFEF